MPDCQLGRHMKACQLLFTASPRTGSCIYGLGAWGIYCLGFGRALTNVCESRANRGPAVVLKRHIDCHWTDARGPAV